MPVNISENISAHTYQFDLKTFKYYYLCETVPLNDKTSFTGNMNLLSYPLTLQSVPVPVSWVKRTLNIV
jgi:hypothetical protein